MKKYFSRKGFFHTLLLGTAAAITPGFISKKNKGNMSTIEKDKAVKSADYEKAASLRDEAQQLLNE